ncbi:hypothetical protein JHK85_006862 [Glycine max]|nr:hypothetical protein JHK85_006862 [Glycine max]KAG5071457.1 hypothetical protein JHK86_006668 [Glycine max]
MAQLLFRKYNNCCNMLEATFKRLNVSNGTTKQKKTIKPGKSINGETREAREKTQKHGGDGADEIMRKLRKERRAYLQRRKRRRRHGGLLAVRRRRDFHFRYVFF